MYKMVLLKKKLKSLVKNNEVMQKVPTTACKYEELEDSEHKCTF